MCVTAMPLLASDSITARIMAGGAQRKKCVAASCGPNALCAASNGTMAPIIWRAPEHSERRRHLLDQRPHLG
jgi:hypothetical protein